uniref:Nucleoporin NUP35 n=1 Tax=Strongyloides venezuelensis TaxID=75913 RepID=A0A0K0G182_STRVS
MTTFVLLLVNFLVYTIYCQVEVENPNLKFLNLTLYDEYSNRTTTGISSIGTSRQYDSSSSSVTSSNSSPLTDEQQNELNYQRIQQSYALNPDPTAGMTFTNNIYGYDYRSNPNDSYTINGNPSQYTPPVIQRFKRQAIPGSDIYAGTAYANQRLLFDDNSDVLQDYTLYDPQNTGTLGTSTNNGVLRDSTSNNGTLMYYPYRTNITQENILQINATNQILLRDQENANCANSDPEWCSEYVRITYQGLTTYDKLSRSSACTRLKNSLRDSISSCCVAVRGIGYFSMKMFRSTNDSHSKPPRESLHNKLNDYSNNFENSLAVSESGDSRMDFSNDSQLTSNNLPDFLFPNKFRYCGEPLRKSHSRPPIISLDDDCYDSELNVNRKKKVTFNETGTLTRSLTLQVKSSSSNGFLNNQEDLSEEKYWVLVFGFNDDNKKAVLDKLKSYGNIIKVTHRKECTFLHVKYSNINCSLKVIEMGSFFINDSVLIGVQECCNLDFLKTESELIDDIPQPSTGKPKINTPLVECRKLDNPKSRETYEDQGEDSMFQKIVNFLLY